MSKQTHYKSACDIPVPMSTWRALDNAVKSLSDLRQTYVLNLGVVPDSITLMIDVLIKAKSEINP